MPEKKLSTVDILYICVMYFGFSFHWTIILFNILPTRVLDFVDKTQQGTYLGIVSTFGAAIALLTCPIIGALSDRSPFRFGRRRPYLFFGVVLNAAGLLGLTYAPKYSIFLLSFLFIQLVTNSASTPYSALLPDKVPSPQRGQAAGIMSFMDVLARILGSIAGGFLMGNIELPKLMVSFSPQILRPLAEKYIHSNPMVPTVLVMIIIMNALMLFTVIKIKEDMPRELKPLNAKMFLEAFYFDIRGNSSFGWLILSRAFNNLGTYTIVCFLLYYINDYLKVNDIHRANQLVGILMAVVSITTLPSALFSGYLSDKIGKRKIFIYFSSVIMIIVSICFITISSFHQALIVGAIFGFAFGTFVTVDWALALDLLPEGENAKALGIWNYSGVGPQVIAPAIGGIILDRFNAILPFLGYKAVFATVVIYITIGTLILILVKERTFKDRPTL